MAVARGWGVGEVRRGWSAYRCSVIGWRSSEVIGHMVTRVNNILLYNWNLPRVDLKHPDFKKCNSEVLGMFMNLIVEIIQQCMCLANHYIIQFKYINILSLIPSWSRQKQITLMYAYKCIYIHSTSNIYIFVCIYTYIHTFNFKYIFVEYEFVLEVEFELKNLHSTKTPDPETSPVTSWL